MGEQRWTVGICSECRAQDGGETMQFHAEGCSRQGQLGDELVEVVAASELEEMTAWASNPENPLFDDGWEAGYRRGKAVRKSAELEASRARERELAAERSDWIKLFNRLDSAVARCLNAAEFSEDAIVQLRAAHDRVLKSAAQRPLGG